MSALRLIAEDAGDLTVLSAYCQDAVLRVRDIAWEPKARRFALMINRFKWEEQGGRALVRGAPPFARVRAGLHFEGVLKVQSSGLRRDDADAVLSLLAIAFTPGTEGAGTVVLQFSGGGAIRLEVECLDAALTDVTDPWPTPHKPAHDLTAKGG